MNPVPFTNIAISLSGGGYRATTFHLGALSLLNAVRINEVSLLERTRVLSTISGGTLTGVMYALRLAQGQSFRTCFQDIYRLLEKDELVERALHKLNNPGDWTNESKTRDVINAFSEVYNEHFYGGATFAALYDATSSHLTDVIFGASEFTTGLQFRFQADHDQGLFGNGNLNLPPEVAREFRLADAAAASSCFPGGFEPMIMPKDFGSGDESLIDRSWYEKSYPTTGVMDGGILDNQGIEGVKLAEERHEEESGKPYIGTYIVSDVSGRKMKPYQVPRLEHRAWKDYITLRSLNWSAAILSLGILIYFWFGHPHEDWLLITLSAIFTITAGWFAVFFTLRSFLRKTIRETFSGRELPEILKDFGVVSKTPIYILVYLLEFRASSVMKMVMDLFLRRIRSLQLSALFGDDKWNGRLKTNNIYTLEDHPDLPAEMREVIRAANTMPTTLWFNRQEKENRTLDKLIACGQLTLCYNLIRYANTLDSKSYGGQPIMSNLSETERGEIREITAILNSYWERFLIDPYWLLTLEV